MPMPLLVLKFLKKCQLVSFFKNNQFLVSGISGIGAWFVFASGISFMGWLIGFSKFSGMLESSSNFESIVSLPEDNVMFDTNIRAKSKVAKSQVLRSKKSEVFCTPPNCCVPPPKDEDKPPPLGF